jgi:hypothetical protein
MAGAYDDDESGSPWRVALYVDERAEEQQRSALIEIFLGRAGGTTATNFAHSIVDVYAVRSARIQVDQTPGRWWAKAEDYLEISAAHIFDSPEAIACGIGL